jgi:hypothetical protein
MAITIEGNTTSNTNTISWTDFKFQFGFEQRIQFTVDFTPTTDTPTAFVTEFADDGSPDNAYLSVVSLQDLGSVAGGGQSFDTTDFTVSSAFFEAHIGATINFEIVVDTKDPNTGDNDNQTIYFETLTFLADDPKNPFNSPEDLQADYSAITRLQLSSDQAATENQSILDKTTTERAFVDGLLSQVQNTTIPAVAVEASMYGAVGTSDEITKLATLFLPAQVQNATHNGLNAQVYACEAVGLAFAFGDENGGTGFATNFGPTAPGMPATTAGDAFFAATAANLIFGSDANANTPGAIQQFVSNWEAFYTSHGVPGISNATVDQIVLASRGAAWGDAVGVALVDNLGPLPGQATNFLEDAARGGALYSKPLTVVSGSSALVGQPEHVPFQGGVAQFVTSSAQVEPVGLAAPDHSMI